VMWMVSSVALMAEAICAAALVYDIIMYRCALVYFVRYAAKC
jgi:hypothetical protein